MKHFVIVIGRQYGSGGHEIGERLAKELDIPFYDNRLIELAAQKSSGSDMESLKEAEEKRANPWLYSMPTDRHDSLTGYAFSINDLVYQLESEVIQQVASESSCVIVGRCADTALEEQKNVLSVFIYGESGRRTARIMARDNLGQKQAEAKMKRMDKQRSCYYNFYSDRRWGHKDSYDLMLNSSALDIDGCVRVLAAWARTEEKNK